MQRVLLALSILFAFLPVANVQAARVDQLIEEMARRNRAQDEAERREEEAEERRRARAEADAVPARRAPDQRVVRPEGASRPEPRPAQDKVSRGASREASRPVGRGSDGCGGRGGPGWRKPNGKCASWRD